MSKMVSCTKTALIKNMLVYPENENAQGCLWAIILNQHVFSLFSKSYSGDGCLFRSRFRGSGWRCSWSVAFWRVVFRLSWLSPFVTKRQIGLLFFYISEDAFLAFLLSAVPKNLEVDWFKRWNSVWSLWFCESREETNRKDYKQTIGRYRFDVWLYFSVKN